jgi:hypothetical protein
MMIWVSAHDSSQVGVLEIARGVAGLGSSEHWLRSELLPCRGGSMTARWESAEVEATISITSLMGGRRTLRSRRARGAAEPRCAPARCAAHWGDGEERALCRGRSAGLQVRAYGARTARGYPPAVSYSLMRRRSAPFGGSPDGGSDAWRRQSLALIPRPPLAAFGWNTWLRSAEAPRPAAAGRAGARQARARDGGLEGDDRGVVLRATSRRHGNARRAPAGVMAQSWSGVFPPRARGYPGGLRWERTENR